MVMAPVFHGTPNAPLWKRNTSGVLEPMWSAVPCRCCGTICDCLCGRFLSQLTEVSVTLSGYVDAECFCVAGSDFTQIEYNSVFNGTYTVASYAGNIYWGVLNDYSNPGLRWLLKQGFYTFEAFTYGVRIQAGCVEEFFTCTVDFYSHMFAGGSVVTQPPTPLFCSLRGPPQLRMSLEWPQICSLTHPGGSKIVDAFVCNKSYPDDFVHIPITMSVQTTCNGCDCP